MENETVTDNIAATYLAFVAENEKFVKGNASAGTRARKALGELTKLAKARRNEITEIKNARKVEQ